MPEAAARRRLEPRPRHLVLPARAAGPRRRHPPPPLRVGGFATKTAAESALGAARDLLAIAAPDDRETARRIAAANTASLRATRKLPVPARVRAAVGAGRDPAVRPPTTGEWLEEWLAGRKKLRPARRAGPATRDSRETGPPARRS